MMKIRHSLFCILFAVVFTCSPPCAGQVAIGTPPFASIGGGPDLINLGNLNAHLTIPVIHKAGRGMAFAYDLSYDSSIWYPVTSSGTTSWQNMTDTTWGWTTSIPRAGHVSYHFSSIHTQTCYVGRIQELEITTTYSSWTYYDGLGTPHPFPGSSYVSHGCTSDSGGFSSIATDGSGYSISITGTSVNSLTARDGSVINPYTGGLTLQDRNGNEITASGGSYYDTLSSTTPVLTIAGSGTPTSPITYTYTAPSGSSASYTVNYTSYTVATNFGVSGIGEFPRTAESLVGSIVMPDGTQYTFTYEPTPSIPSSGACTPLSGTYSANCVTARIASVQLPTHGTISYAYSGGNNGILADGTTPTLKRTTPDGMWTYARSGSGSAWTTTITDPSSAANQSVINFQEESTQQNFYETERQVYTGLSTSGTLLKTLITCYNGSTPNCNSTAITLPITHRTITDQLPGAGLQCKYNYDYNSFGLLTEEDDYDFGIGAPGPLIREQTDTFKGVGNAQARQVSTIHDGSAHVISQTTFNYDETPVVATTGTPQHISVGSARANVTSIVSLVGGTQTLKQVRTIFDTGNIQTVTDVNGAQTSYNYGAGSCGNSFATSVSEPLSLSRSLTWNCIGGVETAVVDENNQITSTNFNDPYFWRPNSTQDAASNVTNITYNGPLSTESAVLFNTGNSSTIDTLSTVDVLGRTHVSQVREGPSSSTYDSVETDYDALGRPNRKTLFYAGTASQTNSLAPATNTIYDALGRPIQVTNTGGTNMTISYSNNDTYQTLGPAPGVENPKRKQLEFNSIGQLTSVCEISSGTGSGTCGQTNSATGFWTKYSYDANGHLTTVTQNAQAPTGSQQTRSYAYDGLGRMTTETNPETNPASGSATPTLYFYDTDATCGTFKGDIVKLVDQVGNTICYAHDAMHRFQSVTFSGPYASNTPNKYFVYDSATVNSIVMLNTKGRLAEHIRPLAQHAPSSPT